MFAISVEYISLLLNTVSITMCSCYALSGLSIAQHSDDIYAIPYVFGDSENVVEPTSIVYNIGKGKLIRAIEYFRSHS
jgi:hypothetical protein